MRRSLRLLFWTLLILALTACAGLPMPPSAEAPADAPAMPAAEDESDAALDIGWLTDPGTLNPFTSGLLAGETIFKLTYHSLYRLDFDGSIVPDLAVETQVSEDGTVWTFTIPEGITFHDGEALTADDVAFSLNLAQMTESPGTEGYESATAEDAVTVRLVLNEAQPDLQSTLLNHYILPEHIWGAFEDADAARAFENAAMIGSGPYQMVDYSKDAYLHLSANVEYIGGAPGVEEVHFQTFGDPEALAQALETGELDVISEVPVAGIDALNGDPNISVVSAPRVQALINTVFFNQIAPENCPEESGVCSGHPGLMDLDVRRALVLAVDKDAMVDSILQGYGTPGRTLIPVSMGEWFNSELDPYPFDVGMANQILDDAGYMDRDGDGVREMPDGGEPLVFRINWPADETYGADLAAILAQAWSEIGIGSEPVEVTTDEMFEICCPSFDYDVGLWGWGSPPDPGFLLSLMTAESIPSGFSETGYVNPTYEELFVAQATSTDAAERLAIVHEMQQIVYDDVVFLIPFYSDAVQAHRTDQFTGWLTDEPTLDLLDMASILALEPVE